MTAEPTPTTLYKEASGDTGAKVYDDGYLRIEHDNYYIACGGQAVTLSLKEFLIISRLARNPYRTITSQDIWRHAWGEGAAFNARSLRVHIHRLRARLAPFGLSVESMVNVGYRLALNGRGYNNNALR